MNEKQGSVAPPEDTTLFDDDAIGTRSARERFWASLLDRPVKSALTEYETAKTERAETFAASSAEASSDAVEFKESASNAAGSERGAINTADPVATAPEAEPQARNHLHDRNHVNGTDAADTDWYSHRADTVQGRGGADTLAGRGGDDVIAGGDGRDTLLGGLGADLLTGDSGSDRLAGGRGSDHVGGGDGADTLFGGLGDDHVSGGAGSDRLIGGDGDDALSGGSGADVLSGGRGDDRLSGGKGQDIFSFAGDWGHDTIFDFRDGVDKIEVILAGNPSLDRLSFEQDGAAAIVRLGDRSIRLENTRIEDLDESDFLFL